MPIATWSLLLGLAVSDGLLSTSRHAAASPSFAAPQSPIRIRHDAKRHAHPAFITGKVKKRSELSVHKHFRAFPDGHQPFASLPKQRTEKNSASLWRLRTAQAKVAIGRVALLGMRDLGVLRGITD